MNFNESPRLITNSEKNSFYNELRTSLLSCERFYFSVAFINYSGLQLLLDELRITEQNKVKGRIITSTYLNFTDVNSLKKLKTFRNIETKIYVANSHKGFHTKGYIFEYEDYFKVIVGSSNITQSALKTNIEWNVEYVLNKENEFAVNIQNEYNKLWDQTSPLNENFIEQYEKFMKGLISFAKHEKKYFDVEINPQPNRMQIKALENLEVLRKQNHKKALVIAATGTGKTYLSAFDVEKFQAKRVLFVVHREVILDSAKKTFHRVFPDSISTVYQGRNKEENAEFTFAMINTISKPKNYKRFAKDHFDYVIIDEAHRSFSESYQRILNYFNPKFLLGMTATPERTDGGNIFQLYNNNIGVEIRLRDALEADLVVPFHYFGIADIVTDYEDYDNLSIDKAAEKLKIQSRVDLVIENMEHYGYDGNKRKCLGFCATIDHAKYMAEEFSKFGYNAIALTGSDSDDVRKTAIERLEDDNDPLEFIFTIDIFNEGVDIPTVNLVLMLRPTQSPIVFTQQLGRGLRKFENKEFLTVLDFIGNHKKSFLIPIALTGTKYYDKDMIKVALNSDFSDIPGCTNIKFDSIAKESIFNQLDKVSFTRLEFLKQEYMEFKRLTGKKKPMITDYLMYENSPDPIKFIQKSGSYFHFINKVDKNTSEVDLDEDTTDFLKLIDKMLPIKRVHEFVIIRELLKEQNLSIKEGYKRINQIIDGVSYASVEHCYRYLNNEFFDPSKKNTFKYIKLDNNILTMSAEFKKRIKDLPIYNYVTESLEYGILRYEIEFGNKALDYPYLKIGYRYKMADLGLLANYTKTHSSIRGSGLWRFNDHYYLFVDLHKDEKIKGSSIDYKDKLISKTRFQWQTPNNTAPESETGQRLINHEAKGINLHLFIRKAKKIGTDKIDFYYLGKLRLLSYEGTRPITMQFEFEHEVDSFIFKDLTIVK